MRPGASVQTGASTIAQATTVYPILHASPAVSGRLRSVAASDAGDLVASDSGLETFHVLGVSFRSAAGRTAAFRTYSAAGWTDWIVAAASSPDGPDAGSGEALRADGHAASDPIWVGDATAYEVRFPDDATETAVHVVRDVTNSDIARPMAKAASDSTAGLDILAAASPWPYGIHARTEWGARNFKIHPGMGDPLKGVQMAVVHHTAQPNEYSQAEVPTLVRMLQAYDMDVRHYDDLGYNVVVDKFGGIWEGRGGGLDQPVIGAHALGMNQVATGISVLGNFVDVDPPAAVIDAIATVAGWKLAIDGYDPLSSVTIGADEDQGHPAHPLPLTTPRIVGHRDVGQTECPGRIWNHLTEIRTKAAAIAPVGTGNLAAAAQTQTGMIRVSGNTSPTGSTPTAPTAVLLDRRPVATVNSPLRSAAIEAFQFDIAAEPGPHRVCAFETAVVGSPNVRIGCRGITVVDPNVNPIRPVRLLDTRNSPTLRLKPKTLQPVAIAGQKTVPAEADSIAANVTVTGPTAAGYLTVVPCGSAVVDQTSNVNFVAGQTIPTLVLSKLGTGGQLCLYSDTAVDVIIDVTAWFPAGGGFTGVPPTRLLDTRLPATPLAPGVERRIQVTGRGGVPANAVAGALSVVVTRPKAAGWLSVYPCDTGFTGTSNLNFRAGQTIANLAVSKLAADGSICLRSDQVLDALVDVTGWFAAGAFHPLTPTRIMDTRQGLGTTRIKFVDTIELKIWGQPSIPTKARSVFVNLTVTNPATANYLTVYPCAQVHPGTSNLNFAAGETIPNLTLTKIGINGCVRLDSGADTDVIADAVGYFE
jgi:N-acetylmuramoyl-L-alanine amidase